MRPDILRRVGIMFALMLIWILFSSLLIAAIFSIGIHYYIFGAIFVVAAMLCTWATLFQVSFGSADAVFSRHLLMISGTISAWAFLMILGTIVITTSFDKEIHNISLYLILYSLSANLFLLILMFFLPVYLFQIKPGKYYLISYFGRPDYEFDIKYQPFARQAKEGEQLRPGSLINRSVRMWIRPLDTACMVWDGGKFLFEKTLKDVPMRENLVMDLILKATFTFDPNKIQDSNFALTLSQQSKVDGVKAVLYKTVEHILEGALRNHYYDKPYDRAGSPQLVERLNKIVKERVKSFADSHGLILLDNSVAVIPNSAPRPALWNQGDMFIQQEHTRFNQLTIDAYQGDQISRYELYHYFLQYPDLIQQFLPHVPHVGNLTLGDIDHLLQNMTFDPHYRDKVVSEILRRNYYNQMLPPPQEQLPSTGQLGTGPLQPQITPPPMSDSQQMPPMPSVEHPEFILSCTARKTVMISWSKLVGEMYLHVDGQTMGPFRNAQDSHDTGRDSINMIEYTWQGQTYSIGNYTCQKRRRYGPSGAGD